VTPEASVTSKVKNPKRVEAGRKGALARKAKKEILKVTKEVPVIEEPVIQRPPCQHGINYMKFLPVGGLFLGIFVVGIYMNYFKKENIQQPIVASRPAAVHDPFEMK